MVLVIVAILIQWINPCLQYLVYRFSQSLREVMQIVYRLPLPYQINKSGGLCQSPHDRWVVKLNSGLLMVF